MRSYKTRTTQSRYQHAWEEQSSYYGHVFGHSWQVSHLLQESKDLSWDQSHHYKEIFSCSLISCICLFYFLLPLSLRFGCFPLFTTINCLLFLFILNLASILLSSRVSFLYALTKTTICHFHLSIPFFLIIILLFPTYAPYQCKFFFLSYHLENSRLH